VDGRRRVIDGPQITVDCWAATEADVTDLGLQCRRLIHEMTATVQSGASVHRVEEFGFAASLNDPVSNSPMSRLTVQIQMRGAAA
jgi:aromatic ring-opening dioxygenase catalytic subunit (LigB family)